MATLESSPVLGQNTNQDADEGNIRNAQVINTSNWGRHGDNCLDCVLISFSLMTLLQGSFTQMTCSVLP